MPHIPRRPLGHNAVHIGPTDPATVVRTTIHLRRRTGHPPMLSFDDFVDCPDLPRPSPTEFAAKWGASQEDADAMIAHCQTHGLTVIEVHLGRRQLTVEGNVGQFSQAFGLDVHDYTKPSLKKGKPHVTFRSHGPVQLSDDLFPRVVGVFGIDNEPKLHRNVANDPTTITPVYMPPQLGTLYNYPTAPYVLNSTTAPNGFVATGQTIGLICLPGDGFNLADIYQSSFNSNATGATHPNGTGAGLGYPWLQTGNATQDHGALLSIVIVSVDGTTNPGTAPGGEYESLLDIMMLLWFSATPKIVTYFYGINTDITSVFSRMVHPNAGDPVCNILSFSFGGSEDTAWSSAELAASESIFQDAAMLGITILASSGDTGSSNDQNSPPADFNTHVSYPAISPWVTSVGGTVVGNPAIGFSVAVPAQITSSTTFTEWVWNETAAGGGATGGGISKIFPVPSYQKNIANMPVNLDTGKAGRGMPDIAGNASPQSGVQLAYIGADTFPHSILIGGTSMSCPMYAGLIAVLNTKLGRNLGFINSTLYAIGNSSGIIRDIVTGSDSHGASSATSNGGWINVAGYPVTTGWDACTGWGVVNGNKFLTYLQGESLISYWVQVQASGAGGMAPMSAVAGPFKITGH